MLSQWFEESFAQSVLAHETACLDVLLPPLRGHHALQLNTLGYGRLLSASRISARCCISDEASYPRELSNARLVYAQAEQLPFAAESFDLVLLPHVLEFTAQPHAVLRELERVLVVGGHVILLGFNPLSLWGLWRVFKSHSKMPPWCGRFRSSKRIKDWFALLELQVLQQQQICFTPPFRHPALQRNSAGWESLGQRFWPALGGVYVLVAQKRRMPLTPAKPIWQKSRPLLGVAETVNYWPERSKRLRD